MGPMVPQSTDAVKNVFGPGHRKRMGGLSVQTPLISIYNTVLVYTHRESRYVSVVMIRKKERKRSVFTWNLMMPVQIRVDMKVAIICAAKVTRGGI